MYNIACLRKQNNLSKKEMAKFRRFRRVQITHFRLINWKKEFCQITCQQMLFSISGIISAFTLRNNSVKSLKNSFAKAKPPCILPISCYLLLDFSQGEFPLEPLCQRFRNWTNYTLIALCFNHRTQ